MEYEQIIINKLPYRNLKKVNELITLERPILSLFTNDKKDYFLLYLVDTFEEFDELILWKVKLLDLYSFLYKRISLKSLILAGTKDFLFVVHSDYYSIEDFEDKESYLALSQILLENVSQSWLPAEDSFWAYDIPTDLVSVLEEFATANYVALLRDNSVYFVVEPSEPQFSTTVSTADIVNFLGLLTRSFISFILFDFERKFKGNFSDTEYFQSSREELKQRLIPRVADTDFGSFEVALSVDTLNPVIVNNDDFTEWQKNAIELYKSEVFDLSFNSFASEEEFIEKYPLDVRKKIFNPVYEIANNPRYTVKTTNRLKTHYKPLSRITKEARKAITQSDEEPSNSEPENYEFQTSVHIVPVGSNITALSRSALKRNLLSQSSSDSTDIFRQESFVYKNKFFNAITPLPIKIITRNLIFILVCDVLDIQLNSTDNQENYRNLEKEIYNYYFAKVLNHKREPVAKFFFTFFEVIDTIISSDEPTLDT